MNIFCKILEKMHLNLNSAKLMKTTTERGNNKFFKTKIKYIDLLVKNISINARFFLIL